MNLAKYEVGNIIKGSVSGIEKYGIFMSFDEYYSGLIHISEVSDKFVKDINDYAKVGDIIYAKILEVDDINFQLKLSIKNVKYKIEKTNNLKKIVETPNGFKTLEYKLKVWIEEALKKMNKMN